MELKVGMKVKSNDDENDIFIIEEIENRHVFCKLDNPNEYVTIRMNIEHFKTCFTEVKEKTDPIMESQTYDNINPNHYKQSGKEVIEMMVDIWGKENVAKYCEMNAFKYRMRVGLKPNQPIQQEIDKAIWYENKAKELNENHN